MKRSLPLYDTFLFLSYCYYFDFPYLILLRSTGPPISSHSPSYSQICYSTLFSCGGVIHDPAFLVSSLQTPQFPLLLSLTSLSLPSLSRYTMTLLNSVLLDPGPHKRRHQASKGSATKHYRHGNTRHDGPPTGAGVHSHAIRKLLAVKNKPNHNVEHRYDGAGKLDVTYHGGISGFSSRGSLVVPF